jgi:hypothetical protein
MTRPRIDMNKRETIDSMLIGHGVNDYEARAPPCLYRWILIYFDVSAHAG